MLKGIRKKSLSFITAAIFVATLVFAFAPKGVLALDYKVGDINGDGGANSLDFGFLRSYLLGNNQFSYQYAFQAADVSGDSQVNSLDFGFFRQYLLGAIDKFPAENFLPTSTPVVTQKPTIVAPTKTPTPAPTPQSGQTITITKTIVVAAGTTYDGNGAKIIAKGMGSGDQDEHQDPIFKLEKGANLKNVRIGAPGCDGVHCYGNNVVENVVWEDVGEDALTVKGEGTVTVKGGAAYKADDKVFQLNQPCTFTVSGFTADTFGKVIRQNGNTTFKCTIYIDNCTFKNAGECIARTDSKTTQLYYRNLQTINVKKLWVFPSESQIHTY